MKIIQASSYFYPHVGGVETHVLELSQSLLDMGHEVLVVCADVPKSRPFQVMNGLSVFRFPALDLPYIPYTYFSRRRLSKFNADVIHSHYPPPFISYQVVQSLPKLPHLLTYHCDLELPDKIASIRIPNMAKRIVQLVNKELYLARILSNVRQIVVTTKSYAESSDVLRDHQYQIIPNGIRLDAFDALSRDVNAEKQAKQILFVGRLSSVKGIEYLIEAAKMVLDQQSDVTFLIVGEGEERERLKTLARGYEAQIRFCGHLPRRALVTLYRTSTLLVLPSFTRLEAFGVVLLEAMASETPVVASRIPGVLDVVGDGGLLVKPRDSLELANAILEILLNPRKARAMGKSGRRLVEYKYDWRIIARKILDVYKDITT